MCVFALFCYFNVDSLEEGDVVTECSIKTHEAVETLDFEFYGSNVVNKIIMKVNTLLCTCLVELDHVSVPICISMYVNTLIFRHSYF